MTRPQPIEPTPSRDQSGSTELRVIDNPNPKPKRKKKKKKPRRIPGTLGLAADLSTKKLKEEIRQVKREARAKKKGTYRPPQPKPLMTPAEKAQHRAEIEAALEDWMITPALPGPVEQPVIQPKVTVQSFGSRWTKNTRSRQSSPKRMKRPGRRKKRGT